MRNGTVIEIHPDHVKKWSQTGFADDFCKLAEKHTENFKDLLKPVLAASAGSATGSQEEGAVTANAEDSADIGSKDAASLDLKSWESYDALHSEDEIKHKCVSEIVGVELLKSKSGHFYLLSEKGKVIPKHAIIGGYGTGKQLV